MLAHLVYGSKLFNVPLMGYTNYFTYLFMYYYHYHYYT